MGSQCYKPDIHDCQRCGIKPQEFSTKQEHEYVIALWCFDCGYCTEISFNDSSFFNDATNDLISTWNNHNQQIFNLIKEYRI